MVKKILNILNIVVIVLFAVVLILHVWPPGGSDLMQSVALVVAGFSAGMSVTMLIWRNIGKEGKA